MTFFPVSTSLQGPSRGGQGRGRSPQQLWLCFHGRGQATKPQDHLPSTPTCLLPRRGPWVGGLSRQARGWCTGAARGLDRLPGVASSTAGSQRFAQFPLQKGKW